MDSLVMVKHYEGLRFYILITPVRGAWRFPFWPVLDQNSYTCDLSISQGYSSIVDELGPPACALDMRSNVLVHRTILDSHQHNY